MRVHFTGACGRAIGGLAAALRARGWTVSASDEVQHEPMKSLLAEAGLEIAPGFDADHVGADVEVLVVGSAVGDDNPEVRAARERGIPVTTMARFLGERVLGNSRRIVVAGANGKTTTAAMLAWILQHAGLRPDFLVAGSCSQLGATARFEGAEWAVLEGDEFRSGRGDPRPKFLHYRPDVLVLTNIEFDHPELYADFDELKSRYAELARAAPRDGAIVVPAGAPNVGEVVANAAAPVIEVALRGLAFTGAGMRFEFRGTTFLLPVAGEMNALDAGLAVAAAQRAGVDPERAAEALSGFRGVAGRLQTVSDGPGGTVITDEGYHPQALAANIAALRMRFPGRRLVVALLPRLTGGNDGFQMRELPAVLSEADRVVIAGLFDPIGYPGGEFSIRRLAQRVRRLGTPAQCISAAGNLPRHALPHWRRGDVMLFAVPAGHEFLYAPFAEKTLEEG